MTEVQGTCDDRFESVRDAFVANFDQGLDVGASVAVVLDGEPVVDLWGGSVDAEGETPWAEDTIINVWSTTKTMTALSALLLADRGELDLHAPVARYWPEFKAGGKEAVEVRHLLAHTAGLSGWQEPMAPDDLYDWEKATSLLAAQEPWWEPGTASGYHAITQGYLIGEVVRRASGAASLGAFFHDELAGPLGADFHIGTGAEHDDRVAAVIAPASVPEQMAEVFGSLGADHVAVKTLTNPMLDAAQSATVPWRRAEIPAAGGHGNARSVARVQSVLACRGEVDGRRYLSEAGCRVVFEEQASGTDLVLFAPLRLGIGYGLTSPEMPFGPNANVCFWGGWGGSIVVVDQDARLCVAYVMNRMGEGTLGDLRGASLVGAAYASLAA
ncbi:MAG: beta-lactamase family protein [Actinomycetota bacterium]|nr:beta-lactamase family protein [Acidimicrobiia bacterium]MDQ3293335.1 beta-lactamase family protein [Actinomycetota bacterium]